MPGAGGSLPERQDVTRLGPGCAWWWGAGRRGRWGGAGGEGGGVKGAHARWASGQAPRHQTVSQSNRLTLSEPQFLHLLNGLSRRPKAAVPSQTVSVPQKCLLRDRACDLLAPQEASVGGLPGEPLEGCLAFSQ